MGNVSIRLFTAEDISLLDEMQECKNYKHILSKYKTLRNQAFVFLVGNKKAGFMLTEKTRSQGIFLSYFYIRPDYRGKGYSKVFFDLVKNGYLKNETILCFHNKAFTALYEKLGFTNGGNLSVSIYFASDFERQMAKVYKRKFDS